MEIRLQKIFTDSGIMSRRAAEKAIAEGLVTVNGEVAKVGDKADPDTDTVEYKGKKINTNRCGGTYIMLNKPVGYVTTMSDDRERLTVKDLVRGIKTRIYPVGRLDMYSEGMLIMTDDGELTNKLTHPSHGFTKTYIAETPDRVTEETVSTLREPFEIDGRLITPPTVEIDGRDGGNTYIKIVIGEGRNRQVRRMCERAGIKLTRLTRVKIGELTLGDLPLGKWRSLTEDEINYLKETN